MLGDGIRRNIATVSKEERDLLRDAFLALHKKFFAGPHTVSPQDGVSYWFKQDQIHDSTHVHVCPAFLPWHRELLNRFEGMLREINPALSLHYWDWTANPQALTDSDGKTFSLFTSDFMGNPTGPIGDPWEKAGFYGGTGPYRDPLGIPANPPQIVDRNVGGNVGDPQSLITPAQETALLQAPDFVAFDRAMEGSGGNLHGQAHGYIGGTLSDPHTSFRDPFVFLLHSNVDRLFAMWQLQTGQRQRLDPAQVYMEQSTGHKGYQNTKGGERTTIDPTQHAVAGDDDVNTLRPWWGILSPQEPWAGGMSAQTPATGTIKNVKSVRPWGALPGENQQVFKDSRDPSIVIPPAYDTAPHSSYIVTNRDTFSNAEVTAKGSPAVFSSALYVIYDGFEPEDLGVTTTPLATVPPNLPAFTFTGASNISAVNPSASYEDPSGAIDIPQRITISYDLKFANANDFPATTGGELPVNIQASLNYKMDTGTGGTIVNVNEITSAELLLVNQPNPYMVDTEQGDPSPYWLSVDTRVFQRRTSDPALAGVTQGDMDANHNAPFEFIQGVVSAFNSFNPANPTDQSHPFLTQLSEDEAASQLELSQKVGGQRVYNYAVAKVRYLAPSSVDATNVSVFFRVFSTTVSALDYDAAGGTTGNYRRTGNTNASAVPLLGIENDSQGQPETACIPFFASARVDTSTVQMTAQPPDTTNIQTIMSCRGNGAVPPAPPCPLNTETVAYFGAWLDINLAPGDPNFHQFPLSPSGVSGWPDGPYAGALQSIQQLMLGTHHCMVAEIFFWPPGVVSDPIPRNASPASSDRLAQRNLALIKSGNPGYPATHTVQHTFIVKPSVISVDQPATFGIVQPAGVAVARTGRRGKQVTAAATVIASRYPGPDELMIRWNNVPRTAEAAFYLPEIEVDEILSLSALRQHPTVLEKVDAHTLRCRLSDMTFIPLPVRRGTLAGLMSLTLPPGVRTGQVYKFSVEQYSGYTLKTLGAFQVTIPVRPDPEILPEEIRKLAVMRYIQQAIPATSRWHSIFVRYIDQIADRVRGFGGDPNAVKPSSDGGEGAASLCPPPKPVEVCPPDLFCLNIPWKECDLEGELDLKLRFHRKCK